MTNESSPLKSIDSQYAKKRGHFNRVNARILKILHEYPGATRGLTYKQIEQLYQNRYGYRPRIPNRVRELRKQGLVRTEIKPDLHGRKRVHVFLVKKAKKKEDPEND